VNSLRGPNLGVLLITHYQRLLDYIVPDYVHVMVQGRIVRSGGKSSRWSSREGLRLGARTNRGAALA
jgi:Fe-S cluster assembly ATPase SufC